MALVIADRVQETTTVTGTGTATLLGAVQGYQTFAAVGNSNTTYYTIAGGTEWEVGLGTYTSAGTTLARTTVLSSSNSGSLVNFSAGTKNVFVTYPSSQAVMLDATQTVTAKTLTSPTINGAVMNTMASSVITSGTATATTSGTGVDYTGLPSWVRRVTVIFNGVSLSGTDSPIVQLGTGGTPTYVTSGYLGGSQNLTTVPGSASAQPGTSFTIQSTTATNAVYGIGTLVLLESSSNTWVWTFQAQQSTTAISFSMGSVALSGALTAIRIGRSGTNTFDAGKVNILYE